MKKFILKTGFFALLAAVFLVCFDSIISVQLRNKAGVLRNRVWKDLFSGQMRSEIVIMGSSRAWTQYSPVILDSILHSDSYNLGIDGRSINSQILRYNTYKRLNVTPKIIIQNIDMMTLDKDNAYNREQFFPYFYDRLFRQEVCELEQLSFADKHIPGFRYAGYFHKLLSWMGVLKPENYTLTKGYYGFDIPWDSSNFEKITELIYAKDSQAISAFDTYLSKARAENIQVVFVYAPVYIGATEKIKNIEGMYHMYDSIAQKYAIPILDFNYDPMSYDTTYFYNATHLNRVGAELFSIKLAHALDSLGGFRGFFF